MELTNVKDNTTYYYIVEAINSNKAVASDSRTVFINKPGNVVVRQGMGNVMLNDWDSLSRCFILRCSNLAIVRLIYGTMR